MGKEQTADKGEDYKDPVKKDDVYIGKDNGIKKDKIEGTFRKKFFIRLEEKGSKENLMQVCRENRI